MYPIQSTHFYSKCSSPYFFFFFNTVCFYAYGHCPGTRDQCIPDGRFCDGLQDCFENTDEMNCGML